MFNASCQICGKNNHQPNTCCHRANLGYRPFGQSGRSQFGQSPSFPNMSQIGTSSGSSSQAFYAFSDPMGYYGTGSSFDQPVYALNMTGYGHNGASLSQMPGMPMTNEASSSSYGYGSSAPPWYFDFGATSHVTHDAYHISVPTRVSNNASVTVGNGQNIPVAHSGKGILPTPSCTFTLSIVFHVPLISHNLLSVYQFVHDNNCSIAFDSCGYVIQGKTTHQVLHTGTCHKGLYPLLPSSDTMKVLLSVSSSATLWRRRLGHPHAGLLHHLSKAYQLPIGPITTLDCYSCNKAKSHKLPFSVSTIHTT